MTVEPVDGDVEFAREVDAVGGIRGIRRNAYGPIQQYENEMGQTITLVAWPDTTCREGYSMYSLAQVEDLIARFDPGGFMGRNLGVEVDTLTGHLVLPRAETRATAREGLGRETES